MRSPVLCFAALLGCGGGAAPDHDAAPIADAAVRPPNCEAPALGAPRAWVATLGGWEAEAIQATPGARVDVTVRARPPAGHAIATLDVTLSGPGMVAEREPLPDDGERVAIDIDPAAAPGDAITIRAIAADDAGHGTRSAPAALLVAEVAKQPPTARFEAYASAPLTAVFDASGSIEPTGGKLLAKWDADGDGDWDGDFVPGLVRDKVFDEAGLYDVRVALRDSAGQIVTRGVSLAMGCGP